MKTLYLHAGAHKTGSSSIQDNLAKFTQELESIGLTYLTEWNDDFAYPHHKFRSTGNANPLAYTMRWYGDKETYKDFAPEAVFEHLFRTIADKNTVIVSHEDLISAPKHFLETFRRVAEAAGWQVKPVVFVRDQISWHVSNYNQHIRQNRYTGRFEDMVAKSLPAANWSAHVGRFEEVFGKENTIVRLFDKSLVKSSISAFFVEGLGLDGSMLEHVEETKTNVGISTADALVLVHLNRCSDDAQLSNKVTSLLRKLPRGGDCELVTPEMADFIRAYYSESNALLLSGHFSQLEKERFEEVMSAPRARGETLSRALDRAVGVIHEILAD